MDKDACWHAAEEDLISIGLSSKGDIIHLKSFCMPNDHVNLQTLAESVKETASQRISGRGKRKQGHNRRRSKTVYIGWLNYNFAKSDYSSVRQTKGGGIRTETFPNESTLANVLERMKQILFPQGKSLFVELNAMEVGIGTHKDGILDIDYNQTLSDYIHGNNFRKTRLYLLSKKISSNQFIKKLNEAISVNSDSDDNFQIQSRPLLGSTRER